MTFDIAPHRHLYPFAAHYLDRSGNRLHYVDEGAGEPLIMVHGNPTWSFYFRRLIEALRGSHRVIVPDHIGCGLSGKPTDDHYEYTLRSRIDDLEALVDSLDLGGKLTLILHDWGGAIGMGYAARHPERIKRLVLLNTGAFFLPETKRLPRRLAVARHWRIGALLVRGCNAFAAAATRMAVVRPLPADVRRALVAPYNSWANRIATLRFVQDIPLAPGDRAWPEIQRIQDALPQFAAIPALVCWGTRDFVFDHHFLRVWREFLPSAEVHEFADAGHYVLEDAHERIIPLVTRFLAEHPV